MGNPRGDGYQTDGEGPVHEVTVDPFWMDATAVTNARFAKFTEATGYLTEAEMFGWSFVFQAFVPPRLQNVQRPVAAPWWRQILVLAGDTLRGREAPLPSDLTNPVVHISWNDARAFCTWAGTRLPTEAEWEFAARGGREGDRFPWGNELTPKSKHRMNVWQGRSPEKNTRADGHVGTAPVTSYPPSTYGLYCMTGNVWEWCADWFSPETYALSDGTNPTGPEHGETKVMRGGSYLCHSSYCNRYRVDSRSFNTPDSSTGNLGFRTVWNKLDA